MRSQQGRIKLRGAGVGDPLDIRVNYLTDPRDAEVLVDAVGINAGRILPKGVRRNHRGAEGRLDPSVKNR